MWWEGLRQALLSKECVGGQWAKTNGVLARRSSAVKQQRRRVQTLTKYNRRSDSSHIGGNLLSQIHVWCHPNTQIEINVFLLFGSIHQVRRPLLGLGGEHPLLLKLKTAAGLLFYKCHIVPPSILMRNWATPGFLVLINSFRKLSKLGVFMWGSQVWRRVSWSVISLEWTLSSREAALFSLQRIEARIHSALRFTAASVSTCQHQKTHTFG